MDKKVIETIQTSLIEYKILCIQRIKENKNSRKLCKLYSSELKNIEEALKSLRKVG